jgi:biotin carboxyl carrier protein
MRRYTVEIGGQRYVIDVQDVAADRFRVVVGEQTFDVSLTGEEGLPAAVISPAIAPAAPPPTPAPLRPPAPETLPPVRSVPQPPLPPRPHLAADGAPGNVRAPMPGTIVSIAVTPGERVSRGQTLMILEAMKMKNIIKSPQDGTVTEVLVAPGQAVSYDATLLRFAGE